MPRFFISSATCSAIARTWVSDEPLAITKQSVMSETPSRSRITTSFAFRSRQSAAAVCAAARRGRVADDDVMRGIESRTRLCRRSWIFCSGSGSRRRTPLFHKHNAAAQAKLGMENYNAISRTEPYLWIPVISRTGKNGLHTEFRYNYEERKTGSVYAGKNFKRDSAFSYSLTPMLGLVFGSYNGASLALNGDAGFRKLYLSLQTQYTWSRDGKAGARGLR